MTCAFLPATTARRTNHIRLRQGYFSHLGVVLCAALTIVFLVSWYDADRHETAIGQQFSLNVYSGVQKLAQYPKTVALSVLGFALLVEVGFVGVACLVMPWGACDEPLRASFRHALRRVWMQTPHVVLIIATVGAIGIPLSRWDRAWRASYSVPMPSPDELPAPPVPPTKAPPKSQAWRDYEAASQAYHQAWQVHGLALRNWERELRLAQPWCLRFNEAITVDAGFFSSLWLLWALLRSAGAPRVVPPIIRPPRCEACGYNLTTIPLESRCPECGEPVAASLGPDARHGPPWQRRQDLGRFEAWQRCWRDAIRDPVQFGRTLRLTTPGADHRRFLAMHLPIVFLIGAISPAMTFWAVEGRSPIPDQTEFLIIGGPMFGTACTIGALALSLKAATAASILVYRHDRRNVMVGAMQVTCYLIVYLVAWQVFGAGTGICAVSMGQSEWFERLTLSRRVGPEVLAFFMWFIPNLACGIGYWTLVRRAVSGTRYANR